MSEDDVMKVFNVLAVAIGVAIGIYFVWFLSVLGCRFTVWMGTEARLWPW